MRQLEWGRTPIVVDDEIYEHDVAKSGKQLVAYMTEWDAEAFELMRSFAKAMGLECTVLTKGDKQWGAEPKEFEGLNHTREWIMGTTTGATKPVVHWVVKLTGNAPTAKRLTLTAVAPPTQETRMLRFKIAKQYTRDEKRWASVKRDVG